MLSVTFVMVAIKTLQLLLGIFGITLKINNDKIIGLKSKIFKITKMQ
jgi:hypothetical protein